MENIKETLNLGAPIYRGLKISKDDLLLIADDKEKVLENFKLINSIFDKHLLKFTNYKNLKSDFIDELVIKADVNDSISKIYFYQESFKRRLCEILCVEDIEEIDDKIELLGKIASGRELKTSFKELYDEFNEGLEMYEKYNKVFTDANSTEEELEEARTIYKEYYKIGLRYYIPRYTNEQKIKYENYKRFIDNGLIATTTLPLPYELLDGVNTDKLMMLMTYKYLKTAININKEDMKQQAIYYAMPYLRTNIDSEIVLKDGEVINRENLLRMYKRVIRGKDIVPVDTTRDRFNGLDMIESIDILEKEKENILTRRKKPIIKTVGWTTSKILDDTTFEMAIKKREEELIGLSIEERNRIIREEVELYNRKIALLENSKFMEKLYGKSEDYNGYITYVYPNEIVLMEKFFNSYRTYTLCSKEAMYKLDVDGFDRTNGLYNCSKTLLMQDKSCVRIYHTKGYETKARSFIELEETPLTREKTEEFLDKIYKEEKMKKLGGRII